MPLTDEGVHAAAMLLSAYRAGAECCLSQADAAWVRNAMAANQAANVISCPAFRASAGRKSCQKPRPSVAQRKKQLLTLDRVNLLHR